MNLPTGAVERKMAPVFSGAVAYFPDAIAATCDAAPGSAADVLPMLLALASVVRPPASRIPLLAALAATLLFELQTELTGEAPAGELMAATLLSEYRDALFAIGALSWAGNAQHNPGEPLHWAREKSTDHLDALTRHFAESGCVDVDGHRHTTKALWRSWAELQLELETTSSESR